jgi:integrase
MGACVDYLHKDSISGRLSYRRTFPPELREYVPGRRREHKVSLKARTYDSAAALRFGEAAADFDRIVGLAVKHASGAYDPLSGELVQFLADTFLRDHLALEEAATWGTALPKIEYSTRSHPEDDYEECRGLLEEHDLVGLVDFWAEWANEYTSALGFVFNAASAEFAQLCKALGEASCRLWLALDARRDDKAAPTPQQPVMPTVAAPVANQKIAQRGREKAFGVIAEELLVNERLGISEAVRQASRSALRFLKEVHGELTPNEVTKAVVSEWLDLLAKRPSKLLGPDRNLKLRELVKRYEGRDVPRMSGKTIAQHMGMLAAIWNKAHEEGAISDTLANPFKRPGLRSAIKKRDHVELTVEEINAIFALPVFTSGHRPKGGRGEASYWLPLLLFYTGARPEEISQLLVEDFIQDPDGQRWSLRITDEGTHPVKGERKLKTSKHQSGRRTIRVPQPLVDFGLLDYVETLRRAGERALFPELTIKGGRGLLFETFGRWWGQYLKEHGVVLAGEGRLPHSSAPSR